MHPTPVVLVQYGPPAAVKRAATARDGDPGASMDASGMRVP
jgi:hypothetical protein